jgi:ubiquinone/menaquinone biosynthesis C-methylase UbiE
MTEKESASKNWGDKWSDQASLYSDQAARLTELHGADLVALLKNDIVNAQTILDVGCGTGAFAMAYLRQFPMGIPGQTLILSDLSAGMLEKAKELVQPPSSGFQTKIVFQEEDGTTLEGITDDSVDLVVSLFGVFLIPDQDGACKAIQRVLKKQPNTGVVAISSWQFDNSDYLVRHGFGVSLQDAFWAVVPDAVSSSPVSLLSTKAWATEEGARTILSENYKMNNVEIFSAIHSTVWTFDNLWMMLLKNPVSNLQDASEADIQKAKETLINFVTQEGKFPLERPLTLPTASYLCIGRGLASTS